MPTRQLHAATCAFYIYAVFMGGAHPSIIILVKCEIPYKSHTTVTWSRAIPVKSVESLCTRTSRAPVQRKYLCQSRWPRLAWCPQPPRVPRHRPSRRLRCTEPLSQTMASSTHRATASCVPNHQEREGCRRHGEKSGESEETFQVKE